MTGMMVIFSISLYVLPYFDKVKISLRPEPGLLYVTSACQVIGEIAFIWPRWLSFGLLSDKEFELSNPRSSKSKILELL